MCRGNPLLCPALHDSPATVLLTAEPHVCAVLLGPPHLLTSSCFTVHPFILCSLPLLLLPSSFFFFLSSLSSVFFNPIRSASYTALFTLEPHVCLGPPCLYSFLSLSPFMTCSLPSLSFFLLCLLFLFLAPSFFFHVSV